MNVLIDVSRKMYIYIYIYCRWYVVIKGFCLKELCFYLINHIYIYIVCVGVCMCVCMHLEINLITHYISNHITYTCAFVKENVIMPLATISFKSKFRRFDSSCFFFSLEIRTTNKYICIIII